MVRDASRWYRVAAERNVVTFKLEWTTVCVPESRVGSLSSSNQDGPSGVRAYIRAVRLYTLRQHRGGGLTDEGSYSKQRVAPKPSSRHAILSFHNERVPSRSVSRRNFNTLVYLTNVRSLSLPSLLLSFSSRAFSLLHPFLPLLLLLFLFLSFLILRFSCLFVQRFFVLRPYVLFSVKFLQVLPIYQEENLFTVAKSPFCISPPRKRRSGRHVVAVRLESGIYCQLNGPIPRPTYSRRSF